MKPKPYWNQMSSDNSCYCNEHYNDVAPHYHTPSPIEGTIGEDTYGLDQPIYDYFGPGITSGNPPVSDKKNYISTVQNCAFMCHQLSTKLTDPSHHDLRRLLQSTARLCNEQAYLSVSQCVFAKDHALLCAKACDVTQATCQKYKDSRLIPAIQLLDQCRDACYNYANRL